MRVLPPHRLNSYFWIIVPADGARTTTLDNYKIRTPNMIQLFRKNTMKMAILKEGAARREPCEAAIAGLGMASQRLDLMKVWTK